jgi:hypothetical protein
VDFFQFGEFDNIRAILERVQKSLLVRVRWQLEQVNADLLDLGRTLRLVRLEEVPDLRCRDMGTELYQEPSFDVIGCGLRLNKGGRKEDGEDSRTGT